MAGRPGTRVATEQNLRNKQTKNPTTSSTWPICAHKGRAFIREGKRYGSCSGGGVVGGDRDAGIMLLSIHRALGSTPPHPQHLSKANMTHACKPSTQEVKSGKAEVQGHSQGHRRFKAIVYKRPHRTGDKAGGDVEKERGAHPWPSLEV